MEKSLDLSQTVDYREIFLVRLVKQAVKSPLKNTILCGS
ncbi:hypothetical protein HPSD74_0396 [Glaesserella parasuis D74]|nr:hypothetical protein HPSSW114_0172 [Glaesserella parasuis SW114]EQA10696.1 hypothetical protein HPSD74_0396 [Glaesserella parasuis D74]EQA14067.1 hypothetical protein HPSH465_0440 [Glaesserella parasuis H465]